MIKETELLEVKTYRQPSGAVVQLIRFPEGCERLVNGDWVERTCSRERAKSQMASWENFEERIGSEVM